MLKPTAFEVSNLDIEPNPVAARGETTITLIIKNVGEAEGILNAILLVHELIEQKKKGINKVADKIPEKSVEMDC